MPGQLSKYGVHLELLKEKCSLWMRIHFLPLQQVRFFAVEINTTALCSVLYSAMKLEHEPFVAFYGGTVVRNYSKLFINLTGGSLC